MGRRSLIVVLALALGSVGCGTAGVQEPGRVRIYTSITQETVDAVIAAYRQQRPDADVEVFRAPTGELNARLAAERREGGIRADVLWLTDPLSMQQYDADGLLHDWTPSEAEAVSAEYRTDSFWGTRLLHMVIIHREGVEPAPAGWHDLTNPSYEGVAIPDPGFAGSAFGALGFLALREDFGFDYYRRLAASGGVQLQSPDEVVTGVAEGRFDAGMTLDYSARSAIDKGSPIVMVWPEPGAIAMYSPIAVLNTIDNIDAAEAFANFVLTRPAQEAIAATGWQPIRDDVAWPDTGPTVTPDWDAAFDRQEELLRQYRSIFGG